MLIEESEVIESIIVKRELIEDVWYVWFNTYHWQSTAPFDNASAFATLHMNVLAEQHLYPNAVAITTAIMYPIDDIAGVTMRAYSWPCQVIGGRSLEPNESILPYDYGYILKKMARYGRTGRVLHRRALTTNDVHFYPDGRVARKPTDDLVSLRERYYDEFMRQGAYKPVLISLDTDSGIYEEPREVVKFWPSHCVLLRTIADAQTRKTVIAQSFKALAIETLIHVETTDRYTFHLLNDFGDMIPNEELIALSGMVGQAQGGIESTLQYWIDGYTPALAPTWRPTPSLVEFDPVAQNLCSTARQVAANFQEALTALIMSGGETVTRAELLQIMPDWWRVVVCFVRCVERERFTGTPIPHIAL